MNVVPATVAVTKLANQPSLVTAVCTGSQPVE